MTELYQCEEGCCTFIDRSEAYRKNWILLHELNLIGNTMKTKLNPDKEVVQTIKEGLKKNGGQCPCIPKHMWTEDTKCPCKKFRENQDCCCGLFIKE